MKKRGQYRVFHRAENEGKGLWHWLREPFKEGTQGSRRIQGPWRVKPNKEGPENQDGGRGFQKDNVLFHFHPGLALEAFRTKTV